MPALTGRLRPPKSHHRNKVGYRAALSTPGALGFFLAAAPARVGIAMTSLGIVWLVHWGTGSYGAAGVVAGGFAVAEAIVGPQVARLIDRFGQTRVLPLCLVAHALAVGVLVGVVVGHAPLWLLVTAGVVAGATVPQLGALSAARWSVLLPGSPTLTAAFALESLSNEIAFLLGPALVGTVSALVSPVAGSVVAAGLVVGGGFAFAAQRRTAPAISPSEVDGRRPGRLLRPGFAVLIVSNLGIGLFFGSMQVSVTAFAVGHDAAGLAGPLYSVMSCAGVLAGLVFGARRWRTAPPLQLALSLSFLAAACLPLLVVETPAALAIGLAVPGLAVAPTLILSALLTEAIVERGVLTQAFTWLNSACAAGIAIAAALAGSAVDSVGTRAGFGIAIAAIATVAIVGWLAIPALRRAVRPAGGRSLAR